MPYREVLGALALRVFGALRPEFLHLFDVELDLGGDAREQLVGHLVLGVVARRLQREALVGHLLVSHEVDRAAELVGDLYWQRNFVRPSTKRFFSSSNSGLSRVCGSAPGAVPVRLLPFS